MSEQVTVSALRFDSLKAVAAERAPQDYWQQPSIFKLDSSDSERRLEQLFDDGQVVRVVDPILKIAESMFEYEHPGVECDSVLRSDYLEDIVNRGNAFGSYVYFPWSKSLVRYPDKEDHRALRTSRNRNLITEAEQDKLLTARIASVGLSVGSRAVMAMVDSGIGGHYILADPDTLDPTNLNRIDGYIEEVGRRKVDNIAKKISLKDPWITQTHLSGIDQENISTIESENIGLVVEAVDNMAIKSLLRLEARRLGIPYIMPADLHDKSMIDVERYDLSDKRNMLFAGKLDELTARHLAATLEVGAMFTPEEVRGLSERAMLKHTGVTNLTTRMMESVMLRDKTLGGMPQLGTTATMGGAEVAVAAREILLGSGPGTGRYYTDPRKTFELGPESSRLNWLRTAMRLKKYAKGR